MAMYEYVYLYRTERLDYVKELLSRDLTNGVVRLLAAKHKQMISFLQLQETDLQTIAIKALDIALEKYDYKNGAASFKSFYCIIAIRQMQGLIQRLCTSGEMKFSKVSSLDGDILTTEQHRALSYAPSKIDSYQIHDLSFITKAGLTEHERQILDLKLSGHKNQEIALMLSSRAKAVANTYEKAKSRLKAYLLENGMYKHEES